MIADAVRPRAAADVAVVFANDVASEGSDRPSLQLPRWQDALISAVAAANPHTVVVLNTSGAVLMPWIDEVAGVVEAWYPGEQDGAAIAPILFGDVNPSGHLTETFPASADPGPGQDHRRVPGRRDERVLRRGRARRLPLVPVLGRAAAVPVRLRPVLHHVQLRERHGDAAGERRQAPRPGRPSTSPTPARRAGADAAQVYLGLPDAAGEPPTAWPASRRCGSRQGRPAT